MAEHKQDNDQRYYSAHGLNIVFAISSVIFLVSILAMFWKDYDREWRDHQKTFREITIAKDEAALQQAEAVLQKEEAFKTLSEEVARLESARAQRKDAVTEMEETLAGLKKEHRVAMQAMNFEKAELSAVTYKYEQAREHHASNEGALKVKLEALEESSNEKALEVERLDTEIADAETQIAAAEGELTEARRKLDAVTADRDLIERRLARLDRERMDGPTQFGDKVRDLPVLDMFNARYNVRDHQVIVNGITEDMIFTRVPRVDRCSVCHVGIDRPGYEDQENPHRSHPNLDLFLSASSPHPIKEFGCTSCHGGRGRGTSFTSATHMPETSEQKHQWEEDHHWHKLHHWDRPMLPAKYTEAGCYECHAGQTELEGADTLSLGLLLMSRAGCYGCHEIKAYNDKGKPGPSLYSVRSKTTKDWAYRWIDDPKAFREHTWMPAFFNQSNQEDIKNRNQQEIHSMVHYLFEKGTDYASPAGEAPAGDATRGSELVRALGCQGCHMLDDDEYPDTLGLEALRRQQGPQLVGLGSKTTADWIYNWLMDPKSYHAETRMPDLRLSSQEAADISAYLVQSKTPDFDDAEVPAVDETVVREMARDFMSKNMTQVQADEKLRGMSLDDIQMYAGEKLIRRYGCFGCHDIAGFEGARPIGTPLTEEAGKAIIKFDFGLQHDIEHINYAWFEAKLENPRIFDHGLEKAPNDRLKMPNFGFSQHQVDALVTALLGFKKPDEGLKKMMPRTPKQLAIEAGESLIGDLNCRGCHVVDNRGGVIRDSVAYWYENIRKEEAVAENNDDDEWTVEEDEGEEDEWAEEEDDSWGEEEEEGEGSPMAATYSPPNLNGEGAKVQPEWLFHFLQDPMTIRPWLSVRMPTYGLSDGDINTIVKYFNALDDQEFPFASKVAIDKDSHDFKKGMEMFGPTVMNCARCHIQGGKTPAGMTPDNWAPELAMAGERLKPDWLLVWLEDPQSLIPGTKMPQFWAKGVPNSMPTILGGDSLRQRQAVRQYLFSLSDSE